MGRVETGSSAAQPAERGYSFWRIERATLPCQRPLTDMSQEFGTYIRPLLAGPTGLAFFDELKDAKAKL